MTPFCFNDDDLKQINAHGLTVDEVQRQMALFGSAPPYLNLVAPCTPENGVVVFEPGEVQALMAAFASERRPYRLVKFVPASGAASRMFKALLKYFHRGEEVSKAVITKAASAGDGDAKDLLEFMNGVKRFAFYEDLRSVLTENGYDPDAPLKKGRFREILSFLLEQEGLNYAHRPKGLLKFHTYPWGSRTAFEEHLVEAASYIKDEAGGCPLHFTVSPEHMDGFKILLERVQPDYEKGFDVHYHIDFSTQDRATDTIAVTPNNRPFRKPDGRLLFRPGGHGALLRNLNHIDADMIFIKNIDNVVPDHLKGDTFRWKQVIGGYLLRLQGEIFTYMESLSSGRETTTFLDDVSAFLKERLLYPVPHSARAASPSVRRAYLMERLNRPIRVCGMVRNAGEPGGGPFWVEDKDGETSRQIVETAQIDPDSRSQQEIVAASTHFNPVDLVCGMKDWQGIPFDLSRFTDPDAVFISQKSREGKDLKALEHPGLWNGAMARWITLFVEVPGITFNPVKTVNDLLRKEHQPA